MPKVSELIDRLQYLVDDTVPLDTALMLFNEAQEDLSEVSGYAKTATANYYAGQPSIALPIDLVEEVELKIKPISKDGFLRVQPVSLVVPNDTADDEWYFDNIAGYERFGDAVELRPLPKEDGQLLIRYYAALPELTDENSVPVLELRFHKLLPLYAAMKYAQNWKDALDEKTDFQRDYLQGKSELETFFQKLRTKTKSKTVYQYRAWR